MRAEYLVGSVYSNCTRNQSLHILTAIVARAVESSAPSASKGEGSNPSRKGLGDAVSGALRMLERISATTVQV